ncbi:MAG: hypothetical protein ACRDL4_17930 [Thermoleophilaceae bacterium]
MRRLAVLLAAAVAALALPGPAVAHVAGIEYRFPLPVWMYALAGAAAVVAYTISGVLVLGLALQGEG